MSDTPMDAGIAKGEIVKQERLLIFQGVTSATKARNSVAQFVQLDEDTGKVGYVVEIPYEDFYGLGSPAVITVSVVPRDTMNEPS